MKSQRYFEHSFDEENFEFEIVSDSSKNSKKGKGKQLRVKKEIKEEPEEELSEDEDEDDDDDEGDEEEKEDEKKPIKKIGKKKEKNEGSKYDSNDAEEGKTIFIRNIPFSATNNDLKNCFKKYGAMIYALICVDKMTEHSKGTGFVKFKEKESADKCLKESGQIYLLDNPVECLPALKKDSLEEKKKEKQAPKDSRNLYLTKEGVVIAGSKAAEGVSASDMSQRLRLEQWKTQMLKNLHMFVSRTRLIIHNLPLNYKDSDLKNLFVQHSNQNGTVKEAIVMKDKLGESKGFGFVSFTKHEDALNALRKLNNNPRIFNANKRPIVAFSLENKALLNLRQKRLEKSRAKLGIDESDKLSKYNKKQRRFIKRKQKFIEKQKELRKSKRGEINSVTEENKSKKRKKETVRNNDSKKQKMKKETNGEEEPEPYSGVLAKPGTKVKFRSRFNLKTQASVHREQLKKERLKKKKNKKLERIKDTKQKQNKKRDLDDDPNFSKLVSKYREKIESAPTFKKWYEN